MNRIDSSLSMNIEKSNNRWKSMSFTIRLPRRPRIFRNFPGMLRIRCVCEVKCVFSSQLSEVKKHNDELQQNLKRAEQIAASKMGVNGPDLLRKEDELEKMKKAMAAQLAQFDVMKKALMRDLQNRCEKVVSLEIALDEAREQYNQLLRNSDSKLQQKKMAFLERNLDQLTLVQRQVSIREPEYARMLM